MYLYKVHAEFSEKFIHFRKYTHNNKTKKVVRTTNKVLKVVNL